MVSKDKFNSKDTAHGVRFTPEQESTDRESGEGDWPNAEKLMMDALGIVDYANFRASVLDAKGYADRGESIEEY